MVPFFYILFVMHRHLFTYLIVILGLSLPMTSIAQGNAALVSRLNNADSWLNTDSALTTAQCSGHITLIHYWNLGETYSAKTVHQLDEMLKAYPFLLLIHQHKSNDSNQLDVSAQRLAALRMDLPGIVALDSNSSSINRPRFELFDESGMAIPHDAAWNTESIQENLEYNMARFEHGQKTLQPQYWTRQPVELEDSQVLSFPSGISVDEAYQEIYVSDTGHDRIMVFSTDGRILNIIGDGSPGHVDGRFDEARFHHPTTSVIHEESRTIYLLDEVSRKIRILDLNMAAVRTLALKDELGTDLEMPGAPYALHLDGDKLSWLCQNSVQWFQADRNTGLVQVSEPIKHADQTYLHKKLKKSTISAYADHQSIGGVDYFIDGNGHSLLFLDDTRLGLVFSGQDDVAKRFKQGPTTWMTSIEHIHRYGNDLLLIEPGSPRIWRTKDDFGQPRPLLDSIQHTQIAYLADICVTHDDIYFVDRDNGRFGVIEDGRIRGIKSRGLDYLVTRPNPRFHQMLSPIHVHDSLQTKIVLRPKFPEQLILDPEQKSSVSLIAGEQAVLEHYILEPGGDIVLYLIPEENGTQLNLMLDLYLVDRTDLDIAYFTPIQLTIPFDDLSKKSKEYEIDVDIMEGLSY